MMSGYQPKTIRRILHDKLNDWIEPITDPAVQLITRNNALVTGGSIASMVLGEDIKDFDVYFKTHAAVVAVAQYYVSQFAALNPAYQPMVVQSTADGRVSVYVHSDGIASEPVADFRDTEEDGGDPTEESDTGKPPYRPVYISPNAITLSNKVQIVLRFYGTPEDIHKNYDFVHCTNWYEYSTGHLELRKEALESLMCKTLRYTGSLYPLCSMFRLRKFMQRGWKVSAGEMLKIAWQINKLDLTDMNVLREQLIGVDALYFYNLLAALHDVNLESIDGGYLCQVIDKVFGT